MNRPAVWGVAILLTAVIVGCSSSSREDKLMEEVLAGQQKMIDLMMKGDEAAKKDLEKLQTRMMEIKKEIEAMPKEKQDALEKKWKPKMDEAAEKAKKAVMDAMKAKMGDLKNLKMPEPPK